MKLDRGRIARHAQADADSAEAEADVADSTVTGADAEIVTKQLKVSNYAGGCGGSTLPISIGTFASVFLSYQLMKSAPRAVSSMLIKVRSLPVAELIHRNAWETYPDR